MALVKMPLFLQHYDQLLDFETTFGNLKGLLKELEFAGKVLLPSSSLSQLFKREVGKVKGMSVETTSPCLLETKALGNI